MGGFFSTPIPTNPELYVDSLDEQAMDKVNRETKLWKLYCDDLEWASLRLKTKSAAPLTIGRASASDVIILNRTVSCDHGELRFNQDKKCWMICDVGSSCGTVLHLGDSAVVVADMKEIKAKDANEVKEKEARQEDGDTKENETEEASKAVEQDNNEGKQAPLGGEIEKSKSAEFALTSNCAAYLGKSLLVLVSDRLVPSIIIECTASPNKEHVGKTWQVTETKSVTAGTNEEANIVLSNDTGFASKEFSIFKYGGWFAVVDSGYGHRRTQEPKELKGDNGEAADGDKNEEKEKKKSTKDRIGVYVNFKKVPPKTMNFLWMGAQIQLAKFDEKLQKLKVSSSYVVKCAIKPDK